MTKIYGEGGATAICADDLIPETTEDEFEVELNLFERKQQQQQQKRKYHKPPTAMGIGETITSFQPPNNNGGGDSSGGVDIDSTNRSSSNNNEKDKKYADAKPVPFLSLFRHGTPKDKLIILIGIIVQSLVGLSFAAMNLVFGEVLDNLASTTDILGNTIGTIKIMAILAAVFGAAAFIGMSAIPYGAARLTNRVRNAYVTAVLSQDMAFFDESKPGEIVAALAEYTLDFEEGLSIKLGEGLQATFGGLGGLVVALYFSWQITLMCLVTVPIMAFSFYMILQSGAGNDGLLGKEAYEAAANVADETLSSMPTVASFAGETKAASRYEDHLGEAEEVAIRQVCVCVFFFNYYFIDLVQSLTFIHHPPSPLLYFRARSLDLVPDSSGAPSLV